MFEVSETRAEEGFQGRPGNVRHAVIKYIPDLIRQEPINVGVVVQGQGITRWRVIDTAAARQRETLHNAFTPEALDAQLRALFATATAAVFIPGSGRRTLETSGAEYLTHARRSLGPRILLGDPLESALQLSPASTLGTDAALLGYLDEVYNIYVEPQPSGAFAKAGRGPRIHTLLKRQFTLLNVLDGRVKEHEPVYGTRRWNPDFAYKNGRTVAISGLDLKNATAESGAFKLVAQWADIGDTNRDRVERVTVVLYSNRNQGVERELANLVKAQSDRFYDLAENGVEFLNKIGEDLHIPVPPLIAAGGEARIRSLRPFPKIDDDQQRSLQLLPHVDEES